MSTRAMIEALVIEQTPNACVVAIDERERSYVVTIAGTTMVLARCEVPRAAADAALTESPARRRLAFALKRTADDTIAEVPDARG